MKGMRIVCRQELAGAGVFPDSSDIPALCRSSSCPTYSCLEIESQSFLLTWRELK